MASETIGVHLLFSAEFLCRVSSSAEEMEDQRTQPSSGRWPTLAYALSDCNESI